MNGLFEQRRTSDLAAPNPPILSVEERHAIAEHLHLLLTDSLFANSKRIPQFLRYVVARALEEVSEVQFKERTLGIDVFGRPNDYDTNADPIVRMTAGEVRKKLAQYYYANTSSIVQIEIPLGSYAPRFRFAESSTTLVPVVEAPLVTLPLPPDEPELPLDISNAPAPKNETAPHFQRASLLVLSLALLAGAGLFGWRVTHRQSVVDHFWNSLGASSKQVLLVMPALPRTQQAAPKYRFEAESLALEDAEVATRVSNALNSQKIDSRLVLATTVDLSRLRSNPFVLIGALDNVWTLRLAQGLPFVFKRSDDLRYGSIVDRKNESIAWTEDFGIPNTQIQQDYGIIARFKDPTTDQMATLIAGISAEGTLAAGEAATNPQYLEQLLKAAGSPRGGFEAVIVTRVIGGESGPPQIVDIRTW